MSVNPLKKVVGKDTGFDGLEPDIIRGAKNNDISEVRAALKQDWRVINKQDQAFKMSAVHYAAAMGNASMSSFLLQQDEIDLSLRDRWDRDPLDVAILSGNQDIVDEMFRFRYGDSSEDNTPDDDPVSDPSSPDVIPFKPKAP